MSGNKDVNKKRVLLKLTDANVAMVFPATNPCHGGGGYAMVDLTNGRPSQTNNGAHTHNAPGTNMAGTANYSQQPTAEDTYANQSSIKTQ